MLEDDLRFYDLWWGLLHLMQSRALQHRSVAVSPKTVSIASGRSDMSMRCDRQPAPWESQDTRNIAEANSKVAQRLALRNL